MPTLKKIILFVLRRGMYRGFGDTLRGLEEMLGGFPKTLGGWAKTLRSERSVEKFDVNVSRWWHFVARWTWNVEDFLPNVSSSGERKKRCAVGRKRFGVVTFCCEVDLER